MTPSISTRRVALQVNVPHTTVWRLLKEYQLYPYHLQRVQAVSPADYPARVRFCQWFLQQCDVNPNFPALVLFTDEAQFTRDGITNFHNQHVWAYENPRVTVPSHHQVRFSLNMWAGIIGDRLVGTHVLVNRLTGQAYTNFLENTIPHVLEDTPLINRQHIHFLHDGAPAHFSRTARRYLDRRFPDRWIVRGGPIAWPPRSPDLNPLDFYLWGHLKSLVYSSPVPDLESLRNRIVACSEDIRNTPGVWDPVRRSMRHRCEVCIEAGGRHFEHLLISKIRKVQDNTEGLELIWLHQLLVYVDDVNMLEENPERIRENTEILLEASKAIGLEVNPEKTKYMIMAREQNIIRNGNTKIGYSSFKEVEKFKYLGATRLEGVLKYYRKFKNPLRQLQNKGMNPEAVVTNLVGFETKRVEMVCEMFKTDMYRPFEGYL
ncbi:hypothetical protein ANN_18533 [Periplaneta americana]|uniref:Reverse transcriptase domain-containing protein n=1 Tax=Periplaneta americana TaxID=6978 RepID=A0ABQ8SP06_PERAM|nr:hypothetical protein ANN_18533 [Periplaneta americana]